MSTQSVLVMQLGTEKLFIKCQLFIIFTISLATLSGVLMAHPLLPKLHWKQPPRTYTGLSPDTDRRRKGRTALEVGRPSKWPAGRSSAFQEALSGCRASSLHLALHQHHFGTPCNRPSKCQSNPKTHSSSLLFFFPFHSVPCPISISANQGPVIFPLWIHWVFSGTP